MVIILTASVPLASFRNRWIPHTPMLGFSMLCSDREGYLSQFSLHSSSTNFISQKFSDTAMILAVSVSKHCTLDLSVLKVQGSIGGFLFFLLFCHSRKIFTDHFVIAHVDFGIAFSMKFLSSSAFSGFWKALEQDTTSSLIGRRKVQNTCEISFSCILIFTLNVFLVCKFPTFTKLLLWSLLTQAFWGMFLKPFK